MKKTNLASHCAPSNNCQTSFGARLRHLRRRAGFSQTELAQRAGLHRGTIADLERGRRTNLCLSTARRLAAALGFGVTTEFIAGDTSPLDDELPADPTLSARRKGRVTHAEA